MLISECPQELLKLWVAFVGHGRYRDAHHIDLPTSPEFMWLASQVEMKEKNTRSIQPNKLPVEVSEGKI